MSARFATLTRMVVVLLAYMLWRGEDRADAHLVAIAEAIIRMG